MARTFALIAQVKPVLHRASCSNETIQNAPKHYKMHQYMSLGLNGVDQVRSLRKIPKRLHGTNLCINCTSSTHFAPIPCSIETLPNAPKCYATQQNKSRGSTWLDWVCSLRKIPMWLRAWTFALVRPVLHQVSYGNQMVPIAPKWYETHQNVSLGSNG